jgi:hypothetical protein
MQMPVMAKGVFIAALYGLARIFRQGAKNRRGKVGLRTNPLPIRWLSVLR